MKVGIVGAGLVGSTTAYAMVLRGVGRRIVLVDLNKDRARAEAGDLMHAAPFAEPLMVKDHDYDALEGCKAVIITAGVSQKPGETRLDLLKKNRDIFAEIVPTVLSRAPEAVLIVVTNPVDVMTHLTMQYAGKQGVSEGRVIGSGTMLDTARFRTLLGNAFNLDPHHVHGYVLGEHGDSEVLTWSRVTMGGMDIDSYCAALGFTCDENMKRRIEDDVRNAAYAIIKGKGATYYGIGAAVAKLVEVILKDQRAILTVSNASAGIESLGDVTLSLPRIIGGGGILHTLPLDLSREETEQLEKSAATLGQAIAELDV